MLHHALHVSDMPLLTRADQVLRDCATAFSSLLQEYAYWVDEAWVEGVIPADLQGTYFRNGPGIQVRGQGAGVAALLLFAGRLAGK